MYRLFYLMKLMVRTETQSHKRESRSDRGGPGGLLYILSGIKSKSKLDRRARKNTLVVTTDVKMT